MLTKSGLFSRLPNFAGMEGTRRPYFQVAIFVICSAIWLLSSLPFLTSDADIHMKRGGSRGSWSDEGLYTSQIRNYLNHGTFDISECDAFLKTPLFSAYLVLPFSVFGTSLPVSRLATTCFILLTLVFLVFFHKQYLLGSILLLTTLSFLPIHQYAHLALAEGISSVLILAAAFQWAIFSRNQDRGNYYNLLGLITLACLFKIQFLYAFGLPILAYLIQSISSAEFRWSVLKQLTFPVTLILLVLSISWIAPFQQEWVRIMGFQPGSLNFSTEGLGRNLRNHFLVKDHFPYALASLLAILISIWLLRKKRLDSFQGPLLIFLLAWLFIELHKLPMNYLPTRYLISFYLALGSITTVVLAHFLTLKMGRKLAYLAILGLLTVNTYHYHRSFKNRTFQINSINDYLSETISEGDVIIGSWAPSANWKAKNVAIPIWNNYTETDEPIKDYNARIVFAEPLQEESDFAFLRRGIDLEVQSDSVRQFPIATWKVIVYWIRE